MRREDSPSEGKKRWRCNPGTHTRTEAPCRRGCYALACPPQHTNRCLQGYRLPRSRRSSWTTRLAARSHHRRTDRQRSAASLQALRTFQQCVDRSLPYFRMYRPIAVKKYEMRVTIPLLEQPSWHLGTLAPWQVDCLCRFWLLQPTLCPLSTVYWPAKMRRK